MTWQTKKLSELCDIEIGRTPSRNNLEYWNGDLKWVSISDMKDKYITDTKECITEKGAKESNCKVVPKNTLLMSFKLSIGKLAFTTEPVYTNEAIASLKIKDDNVITNEYLYYVLQTIDLTVGSDKAVKGLTLNKAKLNELKIPYPSKEEQDKIVTILDKADEIRAKKKLANDKLDEFLKSTFISMFGDPETNEHNYDVKLLQDICTDIVDCPHSTPKKVEYKTNYPCIRTSELKRGYISWESMQYLDEDEYNIRVARLTPMANDIVYAREGTYGNAVILPTGYNFSLGQRTMLFRANTQIVTPLFLLHFILSDYTYKQAKNKNNGSTVGHVNVADIKKFKINIPPLEQQNKFAKIVEHVEAQKQKNELVLEQMNNLFNSLSQRAFKGEI